MTSENYDNDELIFLPEESVIETPRASLKGVWNVLVVDDDREIHSITRLALSDLVVANRSLNFIHAHSGEEALSIIREMGSSIAIILLDVVMETDDAGLVVARTMREELRLLEPRIILRTGQPGYAPEEQVIKDYDINDYKTKTELTRSKLVTAIIASIRSYQQILSINQSRIGLRQIIRSAANLMEEHSVKNFCEGVVTQISSLLGLDAGGVVCAKAGSVLDIEDDDIYVLGAAGEFAPYINKKLENLHNQQIVSFVNQCLTDKAHVFESDFSVLYLHSSDYEAAVYIQLSHEISEADRQLLEVFLSSVSVGYENVNLFHQLRTAAFKDWLTKLPNRSEFINMLDNASQAGAVDGDLVVALVDINHFADVNDGLGQDAGNNALVAVTMRLQSAFSHDAKIGRIGADIFGIIGAEADINPTVINNLFITPFKVGEHSLPLAASIGLCHLSGTVQSGIELLKHSNIALNHAKKNIKTNFEYYRPEMAQQTTWRLDMIRKLATDFEARKLELWYQPQVDLVTEQIVGLEALLRWPDENGNYVSPAVFVPLAEYSGLIIDIGSWVIEESCRQLAKLNELGHKGLRMAVNISMPQFRDPNFISSVKHHIREHHIEPDRMELEITESVVMDEPQIVIDALKELKSFGVKVAIDDFGTGFSSMSYLQKLPLDRLKVDRAFVNEITPGKSAFIVETIVTLGNKLGLSTIAEGVEKREQASYMLKLGCDEAQGYLYAKPMPFGELVDMLARNGK